MKKLFMFLFLMLCVPIVMLAQGGIPPADTWFASFSLTIAATIGLAAGINTLLKTSGFVKQLISWLTGILLLVVGNLLNIGFMAELNWFHTFAYGLGTALVANGVFDIEVVKILLRLIGLEPKE
jgi:hypothetical protein